LQGCVARLRCKVALQGCVARLRCKVALQGCVARLRCKVALFLGYNVALLLQGCVIVALEVA
jgi:hypothetical protein